METGCSQAVISEEEKLLKHIATQQRKHCVWHYCFPSITSEAERHNRPTDNFNNASNAVVYQVMNAKQQKTQLSTQQSHL